jgi:methionine-S-sulfoxide reductase
VRTRVGYAGGTTADPTYHDIGDHTEALQIDFDPTRIDYEQLLAIFWQEHEPCSASWSRQYQAILFHTDERQAEIAQRSAAAVHEVEGRQLCTEVRRLDRFYPAEDYHQKYALRRDSRLVAQLRRFFPDEAALRDAPVCAKLNAYCYGVMPFAELQTALRELGFEALGEHSLAGIRKL